MQYESISDTEAIPTRLLFLHSHQSFYKEMVDETHYVPKDIFSNCMIPPDEVLVTLQIGMFFFLYMALFVTWCESLP